MDLITALLKKIVGIGLFALCLPIGAAALGDPDMEVEADDIVEVASITGAAALKDAGVDAEDLRNGFRTIMRSPAEAQADLDNRYKNAMANSGIEQ